MQTSSKRRVIRALVLGLGLVGAGYGIAQASAVVTNADGEVRGYFDGLNGTYGVPRMVRHSLDNKQYIGCQVNTLGGSPAFMTCTTVDAQGVTSTCYSSNAEQIKLVLSLGPDDGLFFNTWGTAFPGHGASECHTIKVVKASSNLEVDAPVLPPPKQIIRVSPGMGSLAP